MVRFTSLGILHLCFILCPFTQQVIAATGQQAAPAPTQGVSLTPRSHEERESAYQAEHRIVLNVLVTDSSGKPITGLKEQDFAVLDNGEPRKLAAFRMVQTLTATTATHVVFMLDTVNNTLRNIAYERREVEKFLALSPGRLVHPTSIAVLSGSGVRVGQPSQDRDTLIGQLQMLTKNTQTFACPDEGGATGQESAQAISIAGGSMASDVAIGSPPAHKGNCLNLRFRLSVSTLNKLAMQQIEIPGRAILVWIGPGWPLLSDPDFRQDTAAIRRNFFDYLVEVSTALREGQVTLDAISSPDLFRVDEVLSDHETTFFSGVPSEDEVTAGSLALPVLAHQSGGRILKGSRDLATDIAVCIADAESYYTLSFDSLPAAKPGELHLLHVKVDRPGVSVRTNTSYYAAQ